MKKSLYLLAGLFIVSGHLNAQKSSFGITVGGAFGSYKIKAEPLSITSKTKAGFTAGLLASIPLGQHFSFMPALNFLQKGGTLTSEDSNDKTNLNYVELPLNFVYNARSVAGNFFVGAGPSLSMGLSGKYKFQENGGEPVTSDIHFGSGSDDDLKGFEAGVNILAGFQLRNGFLITANYNTGLSNLNISNESEPNKTKYHNRYFSVRVGYMFSVKKK